jgi:hypothetical protein
VPFRSRTESHFLRKSREFQLPWPMKMDFRIVIDSSFVDIWATSPLTPVANKHLLSLINDFEDGAWRTEKFIQFVWNNIAETALSHRERQALQTQPYSLLTKAAKNLRLSDSEKDIGKGSELAEIVLYGIMKHKYNALPVVPKIFYKQNTQDNAKGADSVHITLGKHGGFSLWFGEAKFYKSIEDARLGEIIQSIENSLATNKLKKENSIVTNVSDLDELDIDPALRQSIKDALSDKASIDDLKSKIHVPILLIHECAITASAKQLEPGYLEAIKKFHLGRAYAYFDKQIGQLHKIVFKYADIHFHLILFPVPEKTALIDIFVAHAKHQRG